MLGVIPRSNPCSAGLCARDRLKQNVSRSSMAHTKGSSHPAFICELKSKIWVLCGCDETHALQPHKLRREGTAVEVSPGDTWSLGSPLGPAAMHHRDGAFAPSIDGPCASMGWNNVRDRELWGG